MAKVLRWRGQFADIEKKQYTVEIYGEDTGVAAKTITLGANPLVTNEDDNNDLFTPIRTQTGTLEVLDPDGTLMEEMMPADNLDHPVRVKKGDEVVWEGFLSCEVYSEQFTDMAQVTTFNLVSVLGAASVMDVSVVDFTSVSIGNLLKMNIAAMGELLGSEIGLIVPENDKSVLDIRIYASTMYNYNERYDSNGMRYIEKKKRSVESMLNSVCKTFGWCARESRNVVLTGKSTSIVLEKMMSDSKYMLIVPDMGPGSLVYNLQELALDGGVEFAGDNQQKSVCAGAKSVSVSAQMESVDMGASVGPCPMVPATVTVGPSVDGDAGAKSRICICEQSRTGYDERVVLRSWRVDDVRRFKGGGTQFHPYYYLSHGNAEELGEVDLLSTSAYSKQSVTAYMLSDNHDYKSLHVGARYCRYAVGYDRGLTDMEYKDGLHLYCFPIHKSLTSMIDMSFWGDYPIVHLNAGGNHHFRPGFMKFSMNATGVGRILVNSKTGDTDRYVYQNESGDTIGAIAVIIQIGRYYLHNGMWIEGGPGEAYWEFFNLSSNGTTDKGVYFDKEDDGELTVRVFPIMFTPYMGKNDKDEMMTELLVSDVQLSYESEEQSGDAATTATYSEDIGRGSDEIKIESPLVTSIGSDKCANGLMDTGSRYISEIRYQNEPWSRPEINLLNRMVSHYSSPKLVLKLDARPIGSPLAMTVVRQGERRYTAVETSRDWMTNTGEITLIEN